MYPALMNLAHTVQSRVQLRSCLCRPPYSIVCFVSFIVDDEADGPIGPCRGLTTRMAEAANVPLDERFFNDPRLAPSADHAPAG